MNLPSLFRRRRAVSSSDSHSQRKPFFGSFLNTFRSVTLSVGVLMSLIMGGVLIPQTTYAVPTEETLSIPFAVDKVLVYIQKGLETAGQVAIKNGMRSFLEKIAYDTAVWIGSGDENQKPLLFTEDVGSYLQDTADAAAGEMLNTLATENGYVKFDICKLSGPQSLQLQLTLNNLFEKPNVGGGGASAPKKARCTASEVFTEFTGIVDQMMYFVFDPNSLSNYTTSFQKGGNGLSTLLVAWDVASTTQAKAERNAEIDRLKSDAKAKTAKVSGYIQTPPALVEGQLANAIEDSTGGELTLTGDVVADALTVFINTLTSKLLERVTGGLLSFFTEQDIAGSLSGVGSSTGSAGIKAAQEKFASFKTPSFKTNSTVDILTHFANCPEQGADVTNCVVDEGLRSAIEQGWSVQQLADFKDYTFAGGDSLENGISTRNIKVLKRYNVLPVGWVLAAEYYEDFDKGPDEPALTLRQMIAAYSQCDKENYSPYCGLVDPTWTLKAPDVFCKTEGYGEVIADTSTANLDGNPYSPDAQLVTRLASCLDSRSCLSEDDNGNCTAYGYCTEQRRIYRFEGESCPASQASCEVFQKEDGTQAAYLKNTLNYNDCNAGNVGCTWYCTATTADGEFLCADQGVTYSVCDDENGCSCTAGDTSSCTVEYGKFKCTTDTEQTCTMPTVTDEQSGIDSAISFDDNVQACEAEDGGCSEFISVKGGENILFNPSFEQFNGERNPSDDTVANLPSAIDDTTNTGYGTSTFGFYGKDGNGGACTDSSTSSCYGWQLLDAISARAAKDVTGTEVVIQMQSGSTGSIQSDIDTGQPLANRSFVVSYDYQNTSKTDSCVGKYVLSPKDKSDTELFAIEYAIADSFQRVNSTVVTFAPSVTDSVLSLSIQAPNGCTVAIDNVKVEENSSPTDYSQYQANPVYINTTKAVSCSVDEISCEMYTPKTGESTTPIPGRITNPLSEACGNGSDYSNPSCSQCEAEQVGCDAYIEEESPYNAPLKDITGFSDVSSLPAETVSGIASRTGYYCDGTATACNPSREAEECGGAACLPSISIVPSSAQSCSASQVGCEEYVNLDTVAAGGEGKEYYSYVRQCVKPTTEQENNNEIGTYYTFEGSDVSGYQIRSWTLKKSNTGNAPCTNLDVYGDSAETAEAKCIDDKLAPLTCSADDIATNPDCTEYYDADGKIYHLLKSATISVSEECIGIRNSLDNRVYYTIPSQSVSCSASGNLCREYKGSQGDNIQVIVEDDFDSGATTWGGDTSSEVPTANAGLSMALGTATEGSVTEAKISVASDVSADESYVVAFWAKKSTSDTTPLYPFFTSASSGKSYNMDDAGVSLTEEWQLYTVGPFIFPEGVVGDEEFGFKYSGPQINIDNVELRKNSSYYLIHGTGELCNGFEGCEKYQDTGGSSHYLKSFEKICEEGAVGCTSLIDTQNSDSPYYDVFNEENNPEGEDAKKDDVVMDIDRPTQYVVNDEVLCDSNVASCSLFGKPELDANDDPQSFTAQYLLNDPDNYSTILCQEQQRQCKVWSAADGSEQYFKDPGDKTCQYNETVGEWQKPDGSPCPLQNESPDAFPSQPKGPICNGGTRANELCKTDSDCPSPDGDATTYRCSSTENDKSGWAGMCTADYSGCTLYMDPNTDAENENSNFDIDVETNSDVTAGKADNIPDDWNVLADSSNGFYTTTKTPEATACSQFILSDEKDTAPVFDGRHFVKLTTDTTKAQHCTVASNIITVDPNSYYTLSGYTYTDNTTDAQFSIGLLYYNINGEEIAEYTQPQQYAVSAYEGAGRSDVTQLTKSQWMQFHTTIGPNLSYRLPADAQYVRVFIESGNTKTPVYFDLVELSESKQYTYINDTIDGAAESDENSCPDGVNIAEGCVGFRDVTNSSLTYQSSVEEQRDVPNQGSYTPQTCDFNSTDPNQSCDSRTNTADTNTVLKVTNDRECAEWLSCATSGYNPTAAGDQNTSLDCFESGECTCLEIRRCTKRNEETGACLRWAPQVPAHQLNYDHDTSVVSTPGDPSDLESIQNTSGFASVGGQWKASACNNNTCVGGAEHGIPDSCPTGKVEECDDAITYGYYPYDWMPQRGLGGAETTRDLVDQGDFEEVYCAGGSEYTTEKGTDDNIDYDGKEGDTIELARDESMKCTLDWHCRTPQTDAKVQQILEEKESLTSKTIEEINYEIGWCDNASDEGIWNKWTADGGAGMLVIDYQYLDENGEVYNYTHPEGTRENGGNEILASTNGAKDLDLNNVLYVKPQNEGVSEGVQTSLNEGVVNGEEYVLSFDAQYLQSPTENDYIQIGMAHGTNAQNMDLFEVGKASADIVFMVDSSSTMQTYIKNVATNTTALVNSLSAAGIDVQFGIVSTGGSDEPHAVDFADYTGSDYGAANGVTTSFTKDPAVFSAAMNHIAANYDQGSVRNYQALKAIGDNEFKYETSAQADYKLQFRPGASRFVVVLTDMPPESGDPYITGGDSTSWDEKDEQSFGLELGSPYTMYSVTTSSAYPAYDGLTSNLNGKWYDITSSNYNTLLTDISTDMDQKVSDFRFTTEYKHYVIGPITVENKENSADPTSLFIRELGSSGNTPFVIDNISLKPALELNKENNELSKNSTQLADQQCRAYPEATSLACDYTADNGVIYNGWKGYCIEHDDADAKKCLTWWPIDVVAGSLDTTGSQTPMRYSQKSPVYHCLVAKGNADLGACIDDGTMCTKKEDCGDQQCLGNGKSSYTVKDESIKVETGGYTIKNTIDSLHIDDEPHGDPDYGAAIGEYNFEAATFRKYDSTVVDRLVHISEIDKITFNLGTPANYNGDTYEEEKQSWLMGGTNEFDTAVLEAAPQAQDKLFKSGYQEISSVFGGEELGGSDSDFGDDNDGATAYQIGAWCGSAVCTSSMTSTDLGNMDIVFVKAVTGYNARKNIKSAGRVFNDSTPDDETNAGDPLNPFLTMDSKVWNNGGIEGQIGIPSSYTNTTKTVTVEDPNNSSNDLATLDAGYFYSRWSQPDSGNDIDNPDCFLTEGDCGANVMGVKFDFQDGYLVNVYLFYWDGITRWDVGDMENITWTYYLKEPCLLLVQGADSDAVATPWQARIQQENGYRIDGIKYGHAMNGVNSLFGSLGGEGNKTPDKIDGAASGTGFIDFTAKASNNLPFVYLNKGSGSALPYACIGACNTTVCQNDYAPYSPSASCKTSDKQSDAWIGVAGVCNGTDSKGTVYFCNDNADCSGLDLQGENPTTCVGMSSSSSSTGAASAKSSGFTAQVDDDPPDIPDDDPAPDEEPTSGNGSSSSSATNGILSGGGVGPGYSSYLEQLNAATKIGWSRYRQLFADISTNTVWYADQQGTSGAGKTRNKGFLTSVSDKAGDGGSNPGTSIVGTFSAFNEDASSGDQTFDYQDPDTLNACANNERTSTDPYCGIRPKVENIAVNGYTSEAIDLDNGDSVYLSFDSVADPNQEPVQTIRIAWEGKSGVSFDKEQRVTPWPWEAASTVGHYFNHVFTCDPTNPDNYYVSSEDGGKNACEYRIKVQIEDNWEFCSGETSKDRTRSTEGSCTSYDEYTQTIYVRP